jgi:hypothetical protein
LGEDRKARKMRIQTSESCNEDEDDERSQYFEFHGVSGLLRILYLGDDIL